MQRSRMPFRKQQETLDSAKRTKTLPIERAAVAVVAAIATGVATADFIPRWRRSSACATEPTTKLLLREDDPLHHAEQILPQLLVDGEWPRSRAGTGKFHVARGDGEHGDDE